MGGLSINLTSWRNVSCKQEEKFARKEELHVTNAITYSVP